MSLVARGSGKTSGKWFGSFKEMIERPNWFLHASADPDLLDMACWEVHPQQLLRCQMCHADETWQSGHISISCLAPSSR